MGIDGYSDEDVSVIVVWLPMFPGDDEAGAIEAYDIMSMHRVFQFWDPERLSGIAYSREVYPTSRKDIVESLPEDHFLRDRMKDRAKTQTGRSPMWDFAAFYPAEEYHQQYYRRNTHLPYCQFIIAPKVAKLRNEHFALLKA